MEGLRIVPLWDRIALLEQFNELAAIFGPEKKREGVVAVVYHINHERLHLLVTQAIVKIFQLGIPKTVQG